MLDAKSDQNNSPDRVECGNNEWDWTEDSTERESPRKSLRHLQNGKHEQDHSPEQYRKGHNSTRLIWGRVRREFTLLVGRQNAAQIPEYSDGYQIENFCDAQAQQLKMPLPRKIERECRSIHTAPDLPQLYCSQMDLNESWRNAVAVTKEPIHPVGPKSQK